MRSFWLLLVGLCLLASPIAPAAGPPAGGAVALQLRAQNVYSTQTLELPVREAEWLQHKKRLRLGVADDFPPP